MIGRLVGIFVFILGAGISYLTYDQFSDDLKWMISSPSQRISILVENDFQNLQNNHSLPPEWKKISTLNYKMNSPVTMALMDGQYPNIKLKTKTDGKDLIYDAEIEVIDLPDEKNPGFIFQISLFDIKTKNKIFELGRNYYFSALSKKKPD